MKITELVPKIKPYVLRWMQESTVSGAPSPHALNSVHHTGELADSQATQFLKTDGTRTLTGNLGVSDLVTIDGVDVSVFKGSYDTHVGNANAHHNRQHGITSSADHTVAGSALDLVGLTGTNTLGILTPSSAPGATEKILKTNASGVLALEGLGVGAPGPTFTLDVAGDARVTSGASAATVFRVAPTTGTSSWYFRETSTNQIYVYATDSSGDTTLQLHQEGKSHFTGGNVGIGIADPGATLEVGNQVLWVEAGDQHVGINCVPDAQFDLDVAGNLRAQGWIVGKHAIQLSGALMICHFDGPEPYNSDFTGNALGHMGQVPNTSGSVIFRPGVFGKGVQVAEQNYNLCVNPSFELGTAGWVVSGNCTAARSSAGSVYGDYCGAVATTVTGADRYIHTTYDTGSALGGRTFSVSFYWKASTSGVLTYSNGIIGAGWSDWHTIHFSGTAVPTEWTRVKLTFTYTVGVTETLIRLILRPPQNTGVTIYYDAIQIEEMGYVTPYADGSLGDGHSWSGAAHGSMSHRTEAQLYYDDYVDTLVKSAFSVGLHWKIGTLPSDMGFQASAWDTAQSGDNNNRIMIRQNTGDVFDLYINGAYRIQNLGSGSVSEGDEVFIVATLDFDNDEYTLTVYEDDGTKYTGSRSVSLSKPTGLNRFAVGHNYANTNQVNGVIDEFFVVGRVLSADEIQAIFESDAPVFAETSTWSWRSANNLVWADDEGLWGRDANGNDSLGWCGVASKSWGGQSLSYGDFMLGRGTDYLLWDASVPELKIVAGGGGVTLDANGAGVLANSTPIDFLTDQAYTVRNASGTVMGGLGGHYTGSPYQDRNCILLRSNRLTGKGSYIQLLAYPDTSERGEIEFTVYEDGGTLSQASAYLQYGTSSPAFVLNGANATVDLVLADGGMIKQSTPRGGYYRLVSTQNITDETWTRVVYNSVKYQTSGNDCSSGYIYARETGWYMLQCGVRWSDTDDNYPNMARIVWRDVSASIDYSSHVVFDRGLEQQWAGTEVHLGPIYMESGDYAWVEVWHNSYYTNWTLMASTSTVDHNWFSMYRVT